MKKKAIIFLLLLVSYSFATTIKGIGYGDNKEERLKNAVSDLSEEISVEVKSIYISHAQVDGKKYKKHQEEIVNLSSCLPIKGVKYFIYPNNTTAILNSKYSLKVYIDELHRLKKEISFLELKLNNTKNNEEKYTILNKLLKYIISFNKHKIVATLLGGKNIPKIAIIQSQIELQLQKLIKKIPSLEIAANELTKNITQKNIYISPIKVSGSNEVTQFAKVLKSKMATHLKTVTKPSNASYILRGNYEILKDSIFVTLNLLDKNNNILITKTATLLPQAYKNLQYKPKTKTFDESINSGFVKSGKLSVKVGFKGYDRVNGIDLYKGDKVDIVVKTNKPICYYLVGYTLKDNNKFAYLLPISDEKPYISYITGDDVNKAITIFDKVPVESPFGQETLQIFASTLNKKGNCPLTPPKCQENNDGYCVITGKPIKVVYKTRALNLRHSVKNIEKAEDSISWTSFQK